ncbi:lipopolysaccharide biosynthesis protein [Flavihumibacter solisilvae]|uniref:Polysaccharide biosynthesis protein C-terminal domain-containing protein n=1 Tax=Flavihumibacter solisilvae TaxID=1349421 RepID=A0A0C1IHA6_9BACT|nr:lipopolysaccharide biosynthesis protein [Flavihumibacter solisilvae]KIC93565.1 hypothetical protein OI18_17690 [Flavihumibacter solisilvae]
MTAKPASSMEKRTLSGVRWSLAAKFFRQFIQFFFQLAIARILSPAEFGVFSILLVFINLADVVRSLGLGAALIQKKDINDEFLSTVFWINVGTALIIYLVFYLASPFIATVFKMPPVTDALRLYSLVFIIGSMNSVQEALLQKNLEFKRLFIQDSIAVTAGGIAALYFALKGTGVYTLVYQYLIINTISSIILWNTSSWKPSFRFSLQAFHSLRRYSMNLLGNDLLNFTARNIDNLLVGKALGATALGIYSRAYFLMLQPLNLTHQVLARVMFPVLSTYQDDLPNMKRVFLLTTRLFAFIILPFFVYVIIAADELIYILLGSKWMEVAYLLRIFCIYGVIDTIGLTTVWIYKSTGQTSKLFRWMIYNTIVIITAILVGMNWGIAGVAWAYSISFLVFLWIPGWMIAFRIIDIKVWEMFRNIGGSFIAAALAGGNACLVHQSVYKGIHPVASVMLDFVACMVMYGLFSWLINRSTLLLGYSKLFPILSRLRKKNRPAYE